MNERGWGLTASEVRQLLLAEWIDRQQPDTYFSVGEFYNSLADQSANNWDAAHSDLKYLERPRPSRWCMKWPPRDLFPFKRELPLLSIQPH